MEAPDPAQEVSISPAIKAVFEEWGAETSAGVLAGMVYGGTREAASVSRTEQSRLPMPGLDGLRRGKVIRELTEDRVLRIARGTVLGGAKLGAFVALFSAFQHGLAVHRNTRDVLNTVAAGGITGGAFCLTLPGSMVSRLRTAAVGTILGATVAAPLGFLQSTLQAELDPGHDPAPLHLQLVDAHQLKPKYEEGQGVDAVIRRLESRVPDPALGSQE